MVPPDVPADWLRVEVVPGDPADGAPRQDLAGNPNRPVRPGPDGRFHVDELAPGTASVCVRVPCWDRPVRCLADVALGGDAPDPRLAAIDVSGAVHRIDLELVDPSGAPVPRGTAVFAPTASTPETARAHVAFTGGAAALLAAEPWIDVELVAPGFRPRRVAGARDGARIVLEPGIAVPLRLAEGFEHPGPHVTISVGLIPTDAVREALVFTDDGEVCDHWGRHLLGVSACVDEAREVVLRVGHAGAWQLVWPHAATDDGWTGWLGTHPDDSWRVEVGETGLAEPLVVRPDPQRVAELAERAR